MEKARENSSRHEESVPILDDKQSHEQKHSQGIRSRFQRLLHDSIFRSTVRNGSLILTW